jgi:hypothetical protein
LQRSSPPPQGLPPPSPHDTPRGLRTGGIPGVGCFGLTGPRLNQRSAKDAAEARPIWSPALTSTTQCRRWTERSSNRRAQSGTLPAHRFHRNYTQARVGSAIPRPAYGRKRL